MRCLTLAIFLFQDKRRQVQVEVSIESFEQHVENNT